MLKLVPTLTNTYFFAFFVFFKYYLRKNRGHTRKQTIPSPLKKKNYHHFYRFFFEKVFLDGKQKNIDSREVKNIWKMFWIFCLLREGGLLLSEYCPFSDNYKKSTITKKKVVGREIFFEHPFQKHCKNYKVSLENKKQKSIFASRGILLTPRIPSVNFSPLRTPNLLWKPKSFWNNKIFVLLFDQKKPNAIYCSCVRSSCLLRFFFASLRVFFSKGIYCCFGQIFFFFPNFFFDKSGP